MHGTSEPGDRSPKQVNATPSTSQLKSGSDIVQNNGTSFSSQGKGKRRERDHCSDPAKRERLAKADDGDAVKCRPVTNLKSEIARITEKGGLIDVNGVEKLVQLMQPDRNKDLVSRSMLTAVMAATDKNDCLNRFVQLRGLPVLDEWLQDVHKGKIADGNSLKEGDKIVEDFLLVLLRALDKLPVNLHALQSCNIGRSVNHLRSHKNVEIQRKARSLVDTWKKRVEAEMISIDTNSGPTQSMSVWPSKSRLPEASQGGSRTLSRSEAVLKTTVTQNSTSKTNSGRPSHEESTVMSATLSPGTLKSDSSPGSSGKESQPRVSPVGSNSDVSLIREDRGSSSNQSNNCTPSMSEKDDGKGSSVGLITVNKITRSTIRTRRNSGIHNLPVIENQKESSSSRNSPTHKSNALEKLPPSSNSERAPDGPVNDGCSHKLVVKISNQSGSPVQGITAESVEDPLSISSWGSSLVLLDKQGQSDQNSKCKTDSRQNADSKDFSVGSGEEDVGSPAAVPDEEPSATTDYSRRIIEGLPENQMKPLKLQSTSFSPMNALVESCAKYSEANSSLSIEDDVGMNLLASVAAGEISRFDLISQTGSTERSTPITEENCITDVAKSKSSAENCATVIQSRLCVDDESDDIKQAVVDSSLLPDDGLNRLDRELHKHSNEIECSVSHASDCKMAGGSNIQMESRINAYPMLDTNEKINTTALSMLISMVRLEDGISTEKNHPEIVTTSGTTGSVILAEEKIGTVVDAAVLTVQIAGSNQLGEVSGQKDSNEKLKMQNVTSEFEFSELKNGEKIHQTECRQNSVAETIEEVKLGKPDEKFAICTTESQTHKFDEDAGRNSVTEIQCISNLCSTSTDVKIDEEGMGENKSIVYRGCLGENKLIVDRGCSIDHETVLERTQGASILSEEAENHSTFAKAAETTAATGQTLIDSRIKFDLNEGFSSDDVNCGESSNLSHVSPTVQMFSVPFSIIPDTVGISACITLAAPAKGAFVPSEDLMRTKCELGWKGSAATSAFRPAEPKKLQDASNSPCSDTSIVRHGRIPLDIDLNVPDERLLEEIASRDSALIADSNDFANSSTFLNEHLGSRGSGGLDLDLNRVNVANENSHCSTSSYLKGVGSAAQTKPMSGLPGGDIRRDFDLNDGPVIDHAISEHFTTRKEVKSGIPSHLPSAGLRMSSPGLGNFSSWFPPGNTYSTVSVPAILPDRGDQPFPFFPTGVPQRTFGPVCVAPVTSDVYRGSVLSSPPAVPFSSSSFQYPVFPFGTTFPLPAGTFSVGANSYADSSAGARLFAPPLNSQFLGPVGSATPQFQRQYVVNILDNASGVLQNNRKGDRQGLDLNAGPVALESEAGEESFAQHPVASSQAVVEDQAWMYSVPGGILKRKDPEGGWDSDNFRFKQYSWQ